MMVRTFFLVVPLMLGGCAGSQSSLQLSCNPSASLCYRGATIDRQATTERFGVQGQIALNREYL